DLDEFNCHLGLVRAKIRSKKERDILESMQRAIYVIASEVAVGAEEKRKHGPILKKEDADWIKSVAYELEGQVRIKKYFYVPGENELSALIDVARAVARRAERSIVGFFKKEKAHNDNILSYMNCISDILFLLARKAEQKKGTKRRSKKRRS
ncbi:MAG: hypothetical protein WBC00_02260, partial [Candidatus Omnitrophota bacterium]